MVRRMPSTRGTALVSPPWSGPTGRSTGPSTRTSPACCHPDRAWVPATSSTHLRMPRCSPTAGWWLLSHTRRQHPAMSSVASLRCTATGGLTPRSASTDLHRCRRPCAGSTTLRTTRSVCSATSARPSSRSHRTGCCSERCRHRSTRPTSCSRGPAGRTGRVVRARSSISTHSGTSNRRSA